MCIRRGLSHAFPDKREALFPACILNSKLFLFDNHFPEKIEPGAFVKINFSCKDEKIHNEAGIFCEAELLWKHFPIIDVVRCFLMEINFKLRYTHVPLTLARQVMATAESETNFLLKMKLKSNKSGKFICVSKVSKWNLMIFR